LTEVRRISFDTARSDANFSALLDEYAAESAIDGLPKPECQVDMYKAMEDSELIHILGSFTDDKLTGFIILICGVLPHYGAVIATTESFFVSPTYRKSGAGLMLLREAERLAKSFDAVALVVTAPSGGRLAEVMPKAGYRESNAVFIRSL